MTCNNYCIFPINADADVWTWNRGCATQEQVEMFNVPPEGGCFDQYDLDSGEIPSHYVVIYCFFMKF